VREAPRLRGLPTFGLAMAGLVLGHVLAYLIAVPDPHHRAFVLHRTGHEYLPAMAEAALVLALAGMAAVVIRAFAPGPRGGSERFSRLAGRLGLVQVLAFGGLEVVERIVAGAPLSHLALLIAVGSVISYAVILQRDYQLDRLALFVNPEADPDGGGFQIIQLLVALGSGGPLGLGWGEGRQKFFYVPGSHTDGVFAILGEEVGFIGLMAILCIFGFFIYRGVLVTLRSRDRFSMLLCIGIIAWISGQTLINIGGITRTIPLTGVPLPFLSYGGSSLIMVMAAVGVLLSVSRYSASERIEARPAPAGTRRKRGPTKRPAYGRGAA